jgi:hypothetical protein
MIHLQFKIRELQTHSNYNYGGTLRTTGYKNGRSMEYYIINADNSLSFVHESNYSKNDPFKKYIRHTLQPMKEKK